jgi:lysozyme
MQTSEEGIDLIKYFEGWRARAYRDSVGVWTIGYGHTAAAGLPHPRSGMTISKEEGERILKKDLKSYEKAVSDALKVRVTQNQFDALVSFCYNVGPGNLRKSSVLRYVNAGMIQQVPSRLMLWNKAGGRILLGLTRRRAAEGELFRKAGTVVRPQEKTAGAKPNIFTAIFDFIIRLFMK